MALEDGNAVFPFCDILSPLISSPRRFPEQRLTREEALKGEAKFNLAFPLC